jgi:5S rRNA maturation endonuclease (ribonuclease M5)
MRTEWVTLSDLDSSFVRQTSHGENIYRCPYCPTHSPDNRGHLYVNIVKGVGECKRCQTVVRIQLDLTRIESELAALDRREGGDQTVMGIDLDTLEQDIKAMGFTFLSTHNRHQYLQDRNIPGTVAFNCKVAHRRQDNSLLFPSVNPYNPMTFSGWAIRYRDGVWRESKSAKKNIYIPHPRVVGSNYLIVVEGRSDALSLFARGFPGIAVAGATITLRQLTQILDLKPTVLDIFFDADAQTQAMNVAKMLQTQANTLQMNDLKINQVYFPHVKDPAEMDDDDLNEILGASVEIPVEPPQIELHV